MSVAVKTIVFDLDGTLYTNEGLAAEIQQAAAAYLGTIRGITTDAAADLVRETRRRLSGTQGGDVTLSTICSELGGTVAGFHKTATGLVHPEAWLAPDRRVIALLAQLQQHFELVIYTNNNRTLTGRILERLEICSFFVRWFTVEDFWCPKPDRSTVLLLMETLGRQPAECLFVGDRYDVDLRIPQELGCMVKLVCSIDDLLRLSGLTAHNQRIEP